MGSHLQSRHVAQLQKPTTRLESTCCCLPFLCQNVSTSKHATDNDCSLYIIKHTWKGRLRGVQSVGWILHSGPLSKHTFNDVRGNIGLDLKTIVACNNYSLHYINYKLYSLDIETYVRFMTIIGNVLTYAGMNVYMYCASCEHLQYRHFSFTLAHFSLKTYYHYLYYYLFFFFFAILWVF